MNKLKSKLPFSNEGKQSMVVKDSSSDLLEGFVNSKFRKLIPPEVRVDMIWNNCNNRNQFINQINDVIQSAHDSIEEQDELKKSKNVLMKFKKLPFDFIKSELIKQIPLQELLVCYSNEPERTVMIEKKDIPVNSLVMKNLLNFIKAEYGYNGDFLVDFKKGQLPEKWVDSFYKQFCQKNEYSAISQNNFGSVKTTQKDNAYNDIYTSKPIYQKKGVAV